jgi:pilus assembly protein CpaF
LGAARAGAEDSAANLATSLAANLATNQAADQSQEAAARTGAAPGAAGTPAYVALKGELYRRLLERIDLDALRALDPARLREELRTLIERLIQESNLPLNTREQRQVAVDIEHEVMGLGPLEPLLADAGISDILVNGPQEVWIERAGRLEHTHVRFDDERHLLRIIDRIVSRVGRRVDEASPMVDARLPDGSRVNAIIPPLALDGPALSIRKFSRVPLAVDDLVRLGTLTPAMAALLRAMVRARLNLLISGGTGSGKTTTLNVLSAFIPERERIVTIEDAAELQLQQPHVVRLETRPPNVEGRGEVAQRALVRNALRMRPDRIILGEVRGDEAFDMLQAMNTGHDGSMATVHANSPRDALLRVENMIGMAGLHMGPRAARQQIASALTAVLQVQRLSDGRRRIVALSEITGMEGEVVTMQDLFVFEQTGVDAQGQVTGRHRATGVRPQFQARLDAQGERLADDLYDPA